MGKKPDITMLELARVTILLRRGLSSMPILLFGGAAGRDRPHASAMRVLDGAETSTCVPSEIDA